MKAAPITKKPSFPLMKQGDIQNIYHLQMPRWLFTDPRYIGLSLEASSNKARLLARLEKNRYPKVLSIPSRTSSSVCSDCFNTVSEKSQFQIG